MRERHKATIVHQLNTLEDKVKGHRISTSSKRTDEDLSHLIRDKILKM